MGSSHDEVAIGNDLIGRNGLLHMLEKAFHTQNLLLSGPRRIGKTSLLLSLCERKKHEYTFLYGSFRDNYRDEKTELFFAKLGGRPYASEFRRAMEVGDTSFLIEIVRMAAREAKEKAQKFVLIFDDFDEPDKKRYDTGLLFHELRNARMEFENVRFILSGVAGSRIKDRDLLLSGGLNDLIQIAVGPLAFSDAADLANRCLHSHAEVLANRVAWLSDGFPYLIKRIASECNEDISLRKTGGRQVSRVFDAVTNLLKSESDPFYFKEALKRFDPKLSKKRVSVAYEILDQISVGLFDEKSDRHARSKRVYSSTIRILVESGIVERPETGGLRFASKLLHTWWFNRDKHSLRSNTYWPFPLPKDSESFLKSYTDWANLKIGESRESAELSEKAFIEFHRVDEEIALLLGNKGAVGSVLSLKLAEKVLESAQNALKHSLSDDAVFLTLLGRDQDSWANAASSGFPFVGLGGVDEIVSRFENRLVERNTLISSLKEFPELESVGIRTLGIGRVSLSDGRDSIAPFALLAFFSGRRLTDSQQSVSANLLRQACSKLALVTSIGRRRESFSIRSLKNRDRD